MKFFTIIAFISSLSLNSFALSLTLEEIKVGAKDSETQMQDFLTPYGATITEQTYKAHLDFDSNNVFTQNGHVSSPNQEMLTMDISFQLKLASQCEEIEISETPFACTNIAMILEKADDGVVSSYGLDIGACVDQLAPTLNGIIIENTEECEALNN